MTEENAPETHNWRVCGCRDCDSIRWEYWRTRD